MTGKAVMDYLIELEDLANQILALDFQNETLVDELPRLQNRQEEIRGFIESALKVQGSLGKDEKKKLELCLVKEKEIALCLMTSKQLIEQELSKLTSGRRVREHYNMENGQTGYFIDSHR